MKLVLAIFIYFLTVYQPAIAVMGVMDVPADEEVGLDGITDIDSL